MIIIKGLGILLGLILLYLIIIIFFPVLKVKPQPMSKGKSASKKEPPKCRENIEFTVGQETLSGWMYLPENTEKPVACVVLSHGFAGTKDMGLENYALKFIAEGYAVIAYDYRHYGESQGEPRQLYSAVWQLEDLKAAVSYARGRKEIDPDKIVLWGTSAAGNYGIVVAADDQRIAGVIAQCAALDHKADSKLYMEREGIGLFLKLMVHGQRDKGRSRFGLSEHILPAYGRPGTTTLLSAPGAFEGIERLAEDSELFRNEICARFALMPHAPDPLKRAEEVNCPVMLLVCEKDTLVSPVSHVNAEKILGDLATVKKYPIGHFDIYQGEYFEISVADQIEFMRSLNLK